MDHTASHGGLHIQAIHRQGLTQVTQHKSLGPQSPETVTVCYLSPGWGSGTANPVQGRPASWASGLSCGQPWPRLAPLSSMVRAADPSRGGQLDGNQLHADLGRGDPEAAAVLGPLARSTHSRGSARPPGSSEAASLASTGPQRPPWGQQACPPPREVRSHPWEFSKPTATKEVLSRDPDRAPERRALWSPWGHRSEKGLPPPLRALRLP